MFAAYGAFTNDVNEHANTMTAIDYQTLIMKRYREELGKKESLPPRDLKTSAKKISDKLLAFKAGKNSITATDIFDLINFSLRVQEEVTDYFNPSGPARIGSQVPLRHLLENPCLGADSK